MATEHRQPPKERGHPPKERGHPPKEHSHPATEHDHPAKEHGHAPAIDLDRTDQLPILNEAVFEHDAEDAIPSDHTVVLPGPPFAAASLQSDFVRPSGVDLPSLAESVRSVEERISRQHAEYEALSRAYERAQDEAAESRMLRDSLAAREATIAQVLRSLAERDVQLAALQREHTKIVPVLEATSKSASQLESELQTARAKASALASELHTSRETAAALKVEIKRGEAELSAVRSELGAAKIQASSYLDLLRTREWRRGFDQNMFRELDDQVGAVHAGYGSLKSERDRLQGQVAHLEADLSAQLIEAVTERNRLVGELAARDRALTEAHDRSGSEERRVKQLLEAAELRKAETAAQMAQVRSDLAAQIAQLQSEAETRDREMTVLMAHLQEARRPIEPIQADVKRLTEELAAKNAACAEFEEENRNLKATLERTRGALDEREFLIRRLERSETNNANVLGRIQTSIERLGSVPASSSAGAPAAPAAPADWSAELVRTDGERPVTTVLSRRTRIGRATGCELRIESGSVSRHHAMVMVGPRNSIIEDLNSTNGVFVNGRKVTRQVLSDGDAITIGDTQFRYLARPLHRPPEPDPTDTVPKT
jgi:chromosome segregation ATPase